MIEMVPETAKGCREKREERVVAPVERCDARPLPVIQPEQTLTHSLALWSTGRPENHVTQIWYRP